MKSSICILAIFIFSTGCSRNDFKTDFKFIPENSPLSQSGPLETLKFSYTPPDSLWDNNGYYSKHENLQNFQREILVHTMKFDSLKSQDLSKQNWHSVDHIVKKTLANYESGPLKPMIEQFFAQYMIQKSDLLNDNSPEAYTTIKYYSDLLLNSGSTNMGIYYYAFEKLKSKLSGKQQRVHCLKILEWDLHVKQRGINRPKVSTLRSNSLSPKEAKLRESLTASTNIFKGQYNYYRNYFISQLSQN